MSSKKLFILIVFACLCEMANAQENKDTLKLRIFFSKNSSELVRDYKDNGNSLDSFVNEMRTMLSDTLYNTGNIYIRSFASPEGPFTQNLTLSKSRGETLKEYLHSALSIPEEVFIIESSGENWNELKVLAETTQIPNSERILGILYRHTDYLSKPQNTVVGGPKKELMDLDGGRTWRWMEANIFDSLRTAEAEIHYARIEQVKVLSPADITDTILSQETNKIEIETKTSSVPIAPQDSVTTEQIIKNKKIIVAPRTNLLLPLLNVGIELPIGDHFSIVGDYYYPWIGFDDANANCIQALLADIQFRWWINPKEIEGLRGNSLTGSALSLGAYAGYYDFERNMKGFQGEIGCLYLDYSYTFYLAKNWRLALSIGAGIARMPYRTYTVYIEGGKLIRDFIGYDLMKQWIGQVHAGINLSIPILGGER